jgi:hypothetical protein
MQVGRYVHFELVCYWVGSFSQDKIIRLVMSSYIAKGVWLRNHCPLFLCSVIYFVVKNIFKLLTTCF